MFQQNSKKLFSIFLIISLFHVQQTFAKITLINGSYTNRTHVDTALRTANLNFVYEGCDQNPDPGKINLTTDGTCQDAKNYFLENEGGNKTISGTVGEVIAKYEDASEGKRCTTPIKRQLTANYTMKQVYAQFEKQNCKPTHIVIANSENKKNRIAKTVSKKGLCNLKDTKITKKGFPTEEMGILNMRANIDGFKIGDATQYSYDANKGWCIKYLENDPKCGDWATPVPLAYKDGAGKYQMKGVIALGSDGTATIGAVNKTYDSYDAIFKDLKAGNVKADPKKGYISYHTWKKRNGVKRSIVRSFDGNGKHQRSLNFFARNIFGRESTKHWCAGEHCFVDVEKPPLKQHACKKDPDIDMEKGGSGNVCYSCIGMTPGLCAIRPDDVTKVKDLIGENDSFNFSKYGEPVLESDTAKPEDAALASMGIRKKFAEMISKPSKPGCHNGNALDDHASFAPAVDESAEDRALVERVVNAVAPKKDNNKSL